MTPKNVGKKDGVVLAILLLCFIIAVVQPLRSATLSETSAQSSSSDHVPRIALGEISGSPGASLMIPLYYTPSDEPLRSFNVDIDYVSVHLKFQKAALGLIPDNATVEITSKVTDHPADDKGAVRSVVHLSASVDQKSPQGLPAGLLAYLLFDVTLDAKPFKITLNPVIISAEWLKNSAKEPVKIKVVAGTVVVVVPDTLPETTCFFFSH